MGSFITWRGAFILENHLSDGGGGGRENQQHETFIILEGRELHVGVYASLGEGLTELDGTKEVAAASSILTASRVKCYHPFNRDSLKFSLELVKHSRTLECPLLQRFTHQLLLLSFHDNTQLFKHRLHFTLLILPASVDDLLDGFITELFKPTFAGKFASSFAGLLLDRVEPEKINKLCHVLPIFVDAQLEVLEECLIIFVVDFLACSSS